MIVPCAFTEDSDFVTIHPSIDYETSLAIPGLAKKPDKVKNFAILRKPVIVTFTEPTFVCPSIVCRSLFGLGFHLHRFNICLVQGMNELNFER